MTLLSTGTSIAEVIADGAVVSVFQPIVDLEAGRGRRLRGARPRPRGDLCLARRAVRGRPGGGPARRARRGLPGRGLPRGRRAGPARPARRSSSTSSRRCSTPRPSRTCSRSPTRPRASSGSSWRSPSVRSPPAPRSCCAPWSGSATSAGAWPSTTSAPRPPRWRSCRCCGPTWSSSTSAWCSGRPTPAIAEIMNAVNAYAERTGALILAEGIETERHLQRPGRSGPRSARAGCSDGRPPSPDPRLPVQALVLPSAPPAATASATDSPFACLPPGTPCVAPRSGCSSSSASSWSARRCGSARPAWSPRPSSTPGTSPPPPRPLPRPRRPDRLRLRPRRGPGGGAGARAARRRRSAADDPVLGEWDVAVVSPHFTAALLARDLGDTGPDMDRMFEYALTYRARHRRARPASRCCPGSPRGRLLPVGRRAAAPDRSRGSPPAGLRASRARPRRPATRCWSGRWRRDTAA